MMPANLYIVRHGESIGNLAKRKSEQGDNSLLERLHGTHTAQWPLSKKGIEQAKKTGEFLNELCNRERMSFDRMYVSSYARALQTAAGLDLIRAEWRVDTRITERDWGDLDSMTEDERNEKFGESLNIRKVEPFFWAPPNGRSFLDLVIRIRDFIDSLHRSEATNVIVVCHGEVMKAFRIILQQLTPMEYAEMEFSKDLLKRIHNCQVDHYTRRNPRTLKNEERLECLYVYRPFELGDKALLEIAIPQKRFNSSELQQMANKLSSGFSSLTV